MFVLYRHRYNFIVRNRESNDIFREYTVHLANPNKAPMRNRFVISDYIFTPQKVELLIKMILSLNQCCWDIRVHCRIRPGGNCHTFPGFVLILWKIQSF